jgi:polyhydroxyalkanoate synthesis regulator phasin
MCLIASRQFPHLTLMLEAGKLRITTVAMPGFGDLVQKAFYLGVGLAASAGERAGEKLGEFRGQAQKLADEMVAKGEMTTEEARKFVDDMVKQAQQTPVSPSQEPASASAKAGEPRRIEILSDEEEPAKAESDAAEKMRKEVQALQEELRRLKNNS